MIGIALSYCMLGWVLGSASSGDVSEGGSPGRTYDHTIALFWALCIVCVVNMARYFSSLRALLVVLRGCDPLLYQYVDGGGFFTSHGQPGKQVRLVWYIYAQRYRDHHDEEFIRRCERVRRQFILTSALCGLVVVSLIALLIWH